MAAKANQSEQRSEMLGDMLIWLRDETYGRIKELRGDQEQESEPPPADELDQARTTSEVEIHAGLIAREEDKLRFVDEALARLETGTYGVCVECNSPIPVERLNALPFAVCCIECQRKRDLIRKDWGQGTTPAPYDHQWTVPEEMKEPTERGYTTTGPEEAVAIHYEALLGPAEPVSTEPARKRRKPSRKR
jgi:DnaK suppressor protein